ncbi:hypothetical protein [Cereibacter sphaeroides]|uniref:hypothetical protein n=1 Tax=Cereibacter sphaeroides TaxID=1063 RepID=UPI001E4C85A8|nr:hypothetical protein [Cereibacter sphaeroides]
MTAFEKHGFRCIVVDAVLLPSGASTRTLYKHRGDGLVLAVVRPRPRAFPERMHADPESGVAGLAGSTLTLGGAIGSQASARALPRWPLPPPGA